MNIINAQVETLKECFKTKRKHSVIYGTLDDKVIFGNDCRLYIIPKNQCGIDLSNINCVKVLQSDSLRKFVDSNESVELKPTNNIRLLDDKRCVRMFINDEEHIYLDESLMKNFDLKNATFKGKGSRNVVFIYENGYMVGFLLPVVNVN